MVRLPFMPQRSVPKGFAFRAYRGRLRSVERPLMNNIIYLVGLVVIVVAIVSFVL